MVTFILYIIGFIARGNRIYWLVNSEYQANENFDTKVKISDDDYIVTRTVNTDLFFIIFCCISLFSFNNVTATVFVLIFDRFIKYFIYESFTVETKQRYINLNIIYSSVCALYIIYSILNLKFNFISGY